MRQPMAESVCQTCGVCCAHFRVSFYWGEADDAPGGAVPAHLTETVSPHLRCMKGTASKPARCVALEGEVGKWVSCSIYGLRPSTCREFDVLEADGSPNPRCAALRAQLPESGREDHTAFISMFPGGANGTSHQG